MNQSQSELLESANPNLDEDLTKLISSFRLEPADYIPEPVDYPAMIFSKGFNGIFRDIDDFDEFVQSGLSPDWMECYNWANGYRSVYMNLKLRAILTYVEGDIDLTVDKDEKSFNARVACQEEFYKRC